MTMLVRRVLLAVLIIFYAGSARALDDTSLRQLIAKLASDSFADRADGIEALAKSGDPRVRAIITAMQSGTLCKREDTAVICRPVGSVVALTDAISGDKLGEASTAEVSPIPLNNRVRRAIEQALGGLALSDPDPLLRLKAAEAVFKSASPGSQAAIEAALSGEKDPRVYVALEKARAAVILGREDAPPTDRKLAIETLRRSGGPDVIAALGHAVSAKDAAVAASARAALADVQATQALWSHLQDAWYGLSLGSVLFLAAIGLAITFGVMGVINMAHGEMVMIGAYATYVVQEWMRDFHPEWLDQSLFVALPVAFLVTGLIGIGIEQGVIRFLYGRPLETLLATFGLSLVLQQAVRTAFGPSNREVSSPHWMSGSFELAGLSITYGRLWIIVFALLIFIALFLLLRLTQFGLDMRAVTQNRRMAQSMGIRTGRIDALAFGLGSGIAGISGVALSQIDNVSPNLGQSYIIDSFMVVVFGGVGNILGTLLAALMLGVTTKFAEPILGAVLAKIAVLVLIVLFIQKWPRGLFALKGRAVDA